jgi:hypothetical protein
LREGSEFEVFPCSTIYLRASDQRPPSPPPGPHLLIRRLRTRSDDRRPTADQLARYRSAHHAAEVQVAEEQRAERVGPPLEEIATRQLFDRIHVGIEHVPGQ